MATAAREERQGRQETRQESLAQRTKSIVSCATATACAQAFGREEWVFVIRFPSDESLGFIIASLCSLTRTPELGRYGADSTVETVGLDMSALPGLTPESPPRQRKAGWATHFKIDSGIESAGWPPRGSPAGTTDEFVVRARASRKSAGPGGLADSIYPLSQRSTNPIETLGYLLPSREAGLYRRERRGC